MQALVLARRSRTEIPLVIWDEPTSPPFWRSENSDDRHSPRDETKLRFHFGPNTGMMCQAPPKFTAKIQCRSIYPATVKRHEMSGGRSVLLLRVDHRGSVKTGAL